jgi:hypothetical protein
MQSILSSRIRGKFGAGNTYERHKCDKMISEEDDDVEDRTIC